MGANAWIERIFVMGTYQNRRSFNNGKRRAPGVIPDEGTGKSTPAFYTRFAKHATSIFYRKIATKLVYQPFLELIDLHYRQGFSC